MSLSETPPVFGKLRRRRTNSQGPKRMKVGLNSNTRLNAFTKSSKQVSTIDNLLLYFEFNFRMELKMIPIFRTFILLVFAITVAAKKNGIPYDECTWLECFGIKGNNGDCIKSQDCDIVYIRNAEYSQSETMIAHRLYWIDKPNLLYPYAAVGYSKDKEMGDDFVALCYYYRETNILRLLTGVSHNGSMRLAFPATETRLYERTSNQVNLCAWVTNIAFEKSFQIQGYGRYSLRFNLSRPMYILMGIDQASIAGQLPTLKLHLASKKVSKFKYDPCNSEAFILKSFYCSRVEDQRGWNLFGTVHIREKSMRFQIAFKSATIDKTEDSIWVGLSSLKQINISLVQCGWVNEVAYIREGFTVTGDIEDLVSEPPVSKVQMYEGEKYLECFWTRSTNSWTHNLMKFDTSQYPLYLSIRAVHMLYEISYFPLFFPDFIDEDLGQLCGQCVGMRDEKETNNECVSNKNCVITLLVKRSDEKYTFSIRSSITVDIWASVKLSSEESPNERLGFNCLIDSISKAIGEVTFTTDIREIGLDTNVTGVKILNGTLTEDGPRRITCDFEVEKLVSFTTEDNTTTIDFDKSGVYVSIALGRFHLGEKSEAIQSVSLKSLLILDDQAGFWLWFTITAIVVFLVVSVLLIGLGIYYYEKKKRKRAKMKQAAKGKQIINNTPKSTLEAKSGH